MHRLLAAGVIVLQLASLAGAAPDKVEPTVRSTLTPKSREEMLQIVDAAYAKSPVGSLTRDRSSRDAISFSEHKGHGRHVFVAWFCPTSGVASCQVFVFEHDREKAHWKCTKEHRFTGTHDISVELSTDDRMVIRDTKQKEIFAD